MTSVLALDEQDNVRVALRYMHSRFRSWTTVAKAIGVKKATLANLMVRDAVSVRVAFLVARCLKASIDDLLAGRFVPPTVCSHCGQPLPEQHPAK
jgi:hypothetical protein